MRNKIADLNNYLFESIERLLDDDLNDEDLEKEIKRANAVQKTASTIIESGRLALDVKKHLDAYGIENNVQLPLLEEE